MRPKESYLRGEKRAVLMPMTKKQKAALLRDVALFSGISPRQLNTIADLTTEIEVEPGRYIVRQGQVGTGFYLITRGKAKVVMDGKTLARLGPGEFFGELSLLDGAARSADLHAGPDGATLLALTDEGLARQIEFYTSAAGGASQEARDMLPKLFFVHFRDTSFVAERDGELAGFLVGFLSQTELDAGYVHFVGVNPQERGTGLGRELYERFFAVARAEGRTRVSCVTSPANAASLAFHRAIGFQPGPPQGDYDGPGEDRVLLVKHLG